MTLVDTNGLLDLVTDDPDWAEWSIVKLEETALKGALAINDVVCAELSIRYGRIEDLEAMLDDAAIAVRGRCGTPFPRRQGLGAVSQVGRRTNRRPSGFFIRAHAAVSGCATRDGGRYRTYFPGMALIAPGKRAFAILVP